MNVVFTKIAWKDYTYLQKTSPNLIKRINTLIKDIQRTPFQGKGKVEPLKHNMAGYWSRRIDKYHRLVYTVDKDSIAIISCRFHY